MISDILCNAAKEIEDFRENFPAFYEDAQIKAGIDDVLARMSGLQAMLDSPDAAEDLLKQVNPCKYCGKPPSVFKSVAYDRIEIACAVYGCDEDDKKAIKEPNFREAIDKWNAENPKSPPPEKYLEPDLMPQ